MTDDAENEGRAPKLTIGQRLLTALPNLQSRTSSAKQEASRTADDARPAPTTRGPGAGDKPSGGPNGPRAGGGTQGATAPMGAASSDTDADADEDEDVVDEDSTAAEPAPAKERMRDRALKPPPAGATRPSNPYAEMSREELSRSMKYLDDRERKLALAVGPLLVVLDLVLTAVTLHNNHRYIHGQLNKQYANPSTILALGIGSAVVAGLVVVCALVRRRSLTIFALLFAGYGGGLVTMLPAWALAGWLFVHFNRMQKALRQRDGTASRGRAGAKGAGASRVPNNPRTAARAGAAAARTRSQSGRRGRKEPAPTGPAATKRYTPPKPSRPKPPAPSS